MSATSHPLLASKWSTALGTFPRHPPKIGETSNLVSRMSDLRVHVNSIDNRMMLVPIGAISSVSPDIPLCRESALSLERVWSAILLKNFAAARLTQERVTPLGPRRRFNGATEIMKIPYGLPDACSPVPYLDESSPEHSQHQLSEQIQLRTNLRQHQVREDLQTQLSG